MLLDFFRAGLLHHFYNKNPSEDPANGSDTVCLMVTTQHGCISSTCTVIANYTESITTTKDLLPFSVFPNSAITSIQIMGMSKGAKEVVILNSMGNMLIQHTLSNTKQCTIDISVLPLGVYFVRVGTATQKFIKQ